MALMETAWRESILVARGKHIPLPASTFTDIQAATAALPPGARSSMLEDLERGRRLELPWLSGAVVRIAAEVGVEVPTHRLFVTLLGPHVHGRHQWKRGHHAMSEMTEQRTRPGRALPTRRGGTARRQMASAVVALTLCGIGSEAPTPAQSPAGSANVDWPLHNLDLRNSRYAALDEINTSNAAR